MLMDPNDLKHFDYEDYKLRKELSIANSISGDDLPKETPKTNCSNISSQYGSDVKPYYSLHKEESIIFNVTEHLCRIHELLLLDMFLVVDISHFNEDDLAMLFSSHLGVHIGGSRVVYMTIDEHVMLESLWGSEIEKTETTLIIPVCFRPNGKRVFDLGRLMYHEFKVWLCGHKLPTCDVYLKCYHSSNTSNNKPVFDTTPYDIPLFTTSQDYFGESIRPDHIVQIRNIETMFIVIVHKNIEGQIIHEPNNVALMCGYSPSEILYSRECKYAKIVTEYFTYFVISMMEDVGSVEDIKTSIQTNKEFYETDFLDRKTCSMNGLGIFVGGLTNPRNKLLSPAIRGSMFKMMERWRLHNKNSEFKPIFTYLYYDTMTSLDYHNTSVLTVNSDSFRTMSGMGGLSISS